MAYIERVRRTFSHLSLPAPIRPIVVFHSDDWGRTGIPSRAALEELRSSGFKTGSSPWDYYGLETPHDVDALSDVLASVRDRDGQAACFTANFVLANADTRRMREEGWRTLRLMTIADGWPAPWTDDLMPAYRRAVAAATFTPALHGFTHFNVRAVNDALSGQIDLTQRVRRLFEHDIPFLRSLTPETNFALSSTCAHGEVFLPRTEQEEWIENGVFLFERTFGHRPRSACAPGYRANEDTFSLFKSHGIETIHLGPGAASHFSDGALYLARNVAFEPVLDGGDAVETALAQASRAVACGLPAVISTHSINYITRFLDKAEPSRRALQRLLTRLMERFPDLRFCSDDTLLDSWRDTKPGWFRNASLSETARRLMPALLGADHE